MILKISFTHACFVSLCSQLHSILFKSLFTLLQMFHLIVMDPSLTSFAATHHQNIQLSVKSVHVICAFYNVIYVYNLLAVI